MSRASRPRPAAKSERRAPAAGTAPRRGTAFAGFEDVCERSGGRIVFGLALATATILTVVAAIKYRFYLYDDFDLAIFHQATLQILRGSLFTSVRGMPWPGDHSSLVLILIAPLAALIRHPVLLPALQAVALAFSALVVHRIARAELGSAAAAVLLSAAWLLQPALAYLALFEFHPEALAVPALLLTWMFVRERRTGPALASAGFALLCKEDVALVVLALALFPALDRTRRSPRLAGGLVALAIASLALTFAVLKPRFGAGIVEYGMLYRQWGPDTGSALRAMLIDPLRALTSLVGTPGDPIDSALKREYWLHLLLPWAGLPLVAPLALVPALPIVAEHLLAWRRENHVIVFQYAALTLPFLAVAAVHGVARAARGRGSVGTADAGRARMLALVVVVAALAGHGMFGPAGRGIAQTQHATQRSLPRSEDRTVARHRDRMIAKVNGRDHLIAGVPFVTHVSDRADVHSAHHVLAGRYTFSNARYPSPRGIQAALLDLGAPATRHAIDVETGARWDTVSAANQLRLTEAAGDLLLFESGAPDTLRLVAPADSIAPGPAIRFGADLELRGATLGAPRVRAGEMLPIVTTWTPRRSLPVIHQMEIVLADRNGTTVLRQSHLLGYGLWPPLRWTGNTTERYALIVPEDVPPGTYLVAFALSWHDGPAAGMLTPEPEQPGDVVRIGTVEITP